MDEDFDNTESSDQEWPGTAHDDGDDTVPDEAQYTSGENWPGQEWPGNEIKATSTDQWPGQEWPGTEQTGKPEAEGHVAADVREAAHSVIPAATGVLGAGAAGAIAGTLGAGPIGTLVGGAAGMLAGAYLGAKGQDVTLKAAGYDDDVQRAANAEARPIETQVAGMLPFAGSPVATLGQRAAGGAMMGAFSGAQQLAQGKFDPSAIATDVAFGAAMPSGNAATRALHDVGAKAGNFAPGRPDTQPRVDGDAQKADADVSQSPSVAGNNALAQQPAADPQAPIGQENSKATGPENYSKAARQDAGEDLFGNSGFSSGDAHTDPTLKAALAPEQQPPINTGIEEAANPAMNEMRAIQAKGRAATPADRARYAELQRPQATLAPEPAPVEATPPPAEPEYTPEQQTAQLAKVEARKKQPQATLAPEEPAPPVDADTKLLSQLRANGMDRLAVKFEATSPAGRDLIRERIASQLPQASKHAPDRTAEKAGVTNKLGLQANTKADRIRHDSAIDAIQKAYDAHPPTGDETAEQLMARLRAAVNTAHEAHGSNPLNPTNGYHPRSLPETFQWFKKVQELAARRPVYWTPGKVAEFKADEAALRAKGPTASEYPTKDPDAIDAGIGKSRRGGDVAEKAAERQAVNPEDEMIAAMDARRALPSDDAMRDAGLTEPEIARLKQKPDLHKLQQIHDGYAWLHGEWRKVTPKDVEDMRVSGENAKTKHAADRAKMDARFSERPMPNVSDILGSDWQPSHLTGDAAQYKRAAYHALESRTGYSDRQQGRYERVLKNAGKSVEDAVLAAREGKPFDSETEEQETSGPTKKIPIKSRATLAAVEKRNPAEDLTAPLEAAKAKPAADVKTIKGSELSSEDKARYLKMAEDAQTRAQSRAAPRKSYIQEDKYSPFKVGIKDLTGKLADVMPDESGKLDVGKIKEDMQKLLGTLYRKPVDDSGWSIKRMPSYIAKEVTSENQQAGRNIADRLNITGKTDNVIKVEALKAKKEAHQLANTPEKQRQMYDALEKQDPDLIKDAKLRDVFEKTIVPAHVETSLIRKIIQENWPTVDIGRDTEDAVHRRALNGGPSEAELETVGDNIDPIAGPLSTNRRSPVMERQFVALEDAKGNRHIVHLEMGDNGKPNGKFAIWKDYESKSRDDAPSLEFKLNGDYNIGNRLFKMRDATTDEIEANALGNDAKPMQYQRDAAASVYTANAYHRQLLNHLQTIEEIKNSKEFEKYATLSNNEAIAKGWKQSDTPGFEKYWMDDHLREALEDAYQPGFKDDALNVARKLSRAMTQSIFWMPTAHALNVANHWAVGRGFEWIKPQGFRSLAEDGTTAIKSVITHDKIQQALAEHGAGLIYPGIRSAQTTQKLALGVAETIQRSPSKWGPVADKLDMTVGELVRGIYKASSHGMWSVNDMFLTQGILERLRQQGKTVDSATSAEIKDAISHVERHIPNYRTPGRIIGSEEGGRAVAKTMRDPLFFGFGRYRYGMFNSYANMVKNVVHGSGADRTEAIGQMMVMGVLALGVYPYIYKPVAQLLTGNDAAEARGRGPVAPYMHVKDAATKGDWAPLIQETISLSPLMQTIGQMTINNFKDFGGRDIIDKKNTSDALHGDPKAAGRAAAEFGGYLGQQRYSPLSTLNSALSNPKQGALGGLRDNMLDLKNPSPASQKYEAQTPARLNKEHNQRVKKEPNIGDKLLGKLGLN